MRHAFLWALALALVTASGNPALAQAPASGSSIVGVWKLTSFVRKEVGSDKMTHSFGENPAGYRVHTPGGHAFYMFFDGNRKAPAGTLTDADRSELFRTMTAAGGTYVVEGDKVLFRTEVSSAQATGRTLAYRYQITGKTLTMTTDPIKSATGGGETYFVTTYERVE